MEPEPCVVCHKLLDNRKDYAEVWLSVGFMDASMNKVHRIWGGGKVMGRDALCIDCAFRLDSIAAIAIAETIKE